MIHNSIDNSISVRSGHFPARVKKSYILIALLGFCVDLNHAQAEAEVPALPEASHVDSAPVDPPQTSTAEEATSEEFVDETPIVTDPMEMRFRIIKIDRGISRDARLLSSPRIVTLSTVDPISYLDESAWRGKKLGVFHRVPISVGDGEVAYTQIKVGVIKIKSVYQSTLQAEVVQDDLTRGLSERQGEARVVMLGDIARLEAPIVAPTKPKVRRFAKPKKASPFERKDMRWRL